MPSGDITSTDNEENVEGLPPVPKEVHAKNRNKLVGRLKEVAPNSVVLVQGGYLINHYNTDTVYQYRQESYFLWLFGVREPGFYGLVEVKTGKSVLFIPRLPEEYATWMGPIPTPAFVTEKYGVSETFYIDQIDDVLSGLCPQSVLLLNGLNTDSNLEIKPADFPNRSGLAVNTSTLYPIISECRVVKSPEEIELISKACAISCTAHKYVMQAITKCNFEYQVESLFKNSCYFVGGSRTTAYTNNCSTGCNCSILHYGDAGAPNSKQILPGDMCLFDMGASHSGYASDITISFPVSGKFTEEQKTIYEAVLGARDAVINSARPGVSWVDMHILANKVMLAKLTEAGILNGNVDEMIEAGLSGILQPHGLGHLLGIDVHDVGGYLSNTPQRPKQSYLKNLRTARVLEEGIVLTIEPGCYFIEPLLDKALADENLSKFINKDEITKYRGFGGVRIEDVVVITKTGCIVLSPLPRSVEEIEAWMKQTDKGCLKPLDKHYQTPVICK
uniref:Xaa-Pro dipeptidase n=1 Tax=Panstrongylus megistus TaxID=65343 RepID=A0A069DU71_9HEMI